MRHRRDHRATGQPNRAALKRMSDAMVHRGPDASGTWVSAPDSRGWGALLAHRRLSILDLSPAGAQPMVDPVTGHVIVFNGEIYNFRDLRRRLVAEGQELQSTGDTAVMLRALGLHGPGAVSWFRGMFAFACWDPKKRRLLLARDPLGIKPLYLARSSDPDAGWSLAFASELRALLASGLLGTPRLDPQAVASSVWNGFVVGPGTAVKGVELLWPGRLLEFDGAGKEIRQQDFWRIPDRAPDPIMDEDDLAAILEEGWRLRIFAGDVCYRGRRDCSILRFDEPKTGRAWRSTKRAHASAAHRGVVVTIRAEGRLGLRAERHSCAFSQACPRASQRQSTGPDLRGAPAGAGRRARLGHSDGGAAPLRPQPDAGN